MNPRYRRLLIPGLLIVLLAIVVISSLARRAEGAEAAPEVVSLISDPRITESSGLVVSLAHDDLAYTVNDSGHTPTVYALRISTGTVVGATTIAGGTLVDTEALSIDRDGTLWIADTGDNRANRTDVALYALPEPGEGDHAVTARRYPLSYGDGPQDVETLVISPRTGEKFLVSKGLLGGAVFAVPDHLVAGRPTTLRALDAAAPGLLTDGGFTIDGAGIVVRDYARAFVLDASTWDVVTSERLPRVTQGETLAMEPGRRSFLIGSEGGDSPLIRVPFNQPAGATTTAPSVTAPSVTAPSDPPATADARAPDPADDNGFAGATWLWSGLALALLLAVSVAATRARR